ncbi:uncharacterized protein LOC118694456 isoform X2 [Molothrus ater]|uniref:uncharacterized protein LOC118694456 isoform X2 n=1 Tax=Molothrus ater TaxID=84834 RepID=UPI00174E892A|nr:uncharacterized protein LOC118694456 isoform X2 [Molothrus ater]
MKPSSSSAPESREAPETLRVKRAGDGPQKGGRDGERRAGAGSSASGTPAASPACREHNRTNWSIVLQDIYQPPNLLQNGKRGLLSLGRKLHKPHSRTRTKHGRQERKEKKGGGGQRGGRLEIATPLARSLLPPYPARP